MTFTSTYYFMVTNPNHSDLQQIAYNSTYPIYFLKDNTLYRRQGVWNRTWRNWLKDNGIEVCEENAVYHPVMQIENGVITTWETHVANIGNKLLDMTETTRQHYYPNLYFVQIGNHPYSKEGRFNKCWQLENAQRESHRIIYPHYDPKQYFLLPKQLPC